MEKIEPGIYRHFKGHLYFVLGISWDREDPTNEKKAEVIYHPLYHVENIGWRRGISPQKFSECIEDKVYSYSGPRFVKVMNLNMPNVIPGCMWIDPDRGFGSKKGTSLTIIEIIDGIESDGAGPIAILRNRDGNIFQKEVWRLVTYCIWSNMVEKV